ncbi:DoxX family membrane protein [Christiangramia sabulilitoris]|uniref:DoxX family membrane protein n=2 Tax=Christiangramia sabulilitoris TaxID=2583991 RepID=A0A550HXA7_9FLAO|nr:DoxX family membrane protein [Christiangramia sabulilitoris]TRO63351.1 DoxX family membrane protein [Christiangramia sabulilitoris]
MKNHIETSKIQKMFRILLAIFMLYAGFSHLTFNRIEFQSQVPDWMPFSKDLVVILSGIVEMIIGLALLFWKRQRVNTGWLLALFFVIVFPGNVAQYVEGRDAFSVLDSDRARLIRLFFQPVLIAWAVWSTGAWKAWRISKETENA